jgi:hypothetical protein
MLKLLTGTDKRHFTGMPSAVHFEGSGPPRIEHTCNLTESRLVNVRFPRLALERELEEISLPHEGNSVVHFLD